MQNMKKIENIEDLMNSVMVSGKKNGNVSKICEITRQMLQKKPNGVSMGFIAKVATKVLYTEQEQKDGKEVEHSVVRHAVLKSREKDQFEVFDGADGLKNVRMKTHVTKK